MKLERNSKLAELVGIFLGAGDQGELLNNNILKIALDRERYEYIDYIVNLLASTFDIDPQVTDYYEKTIISISDKMAVLAFKRDGLNINVNFND